MCQARTSKGESKITKAIPAIVTKTPENTVVIQVKRRLNPAATEFVSSRSESEVSSVGDEAETEQPGHLSSEEVSFAIQKSRGHKGSERDMDQYSEDADEQERFHSYQNYGWESPQGVLSPAGAPVYPHGHYTATLGSSETDHEHEYHAYTGYNNYHPGAAAASRRARSDGAASPPPGPAVGYTPHPATAGMMPPPHSWTSNAPHSHQYGPPTSYPVYHVYPHPHHPDAVAAGINRSASPPAIYPAGGSPPLAPGFISVPLQHQHSGHLRGPSPPPLPGGSSPPSRGGGGSIMYDKNFPPAPGMHHHGAVSMGSSPPTSGATNYHMYAAPHPYSHHHMNEEYHHHPANTNYSHHLHHHGGHQQYPDNGMMADLQPRMSSMSLGSPAEGGSPTSSGMGVRSNTRASARIARSHRAGGAYNPSDFEFKIDLPTASDDANSTTDAKNTGSSDVKTTVMIRNIPNKYNQESMLSLLEEAGLNGSFDFFYLPIDFRNRCGLGYAFLNFLSHADAVKAYSHFHHRRWDEFNSKKVCEVTYARVQGRDNLVQHFKNAKFPSTDAEYCPLVYRHVDEKTHLEGDENEEEGGDGVSYVRARSPLPIHDYLASVEEEQEGIAPIKMENENEDDA